MAGGHPTGQLRLWVISIIVDASAGQCWHRGWQGALGGEMLCEQSPNGSYGGRQVPGEGNSKFKGSGKQCGQYF